MWQFLRRTWQRLEPIYAAAVSIAIVSLAASVWVTGAMIVAFPHHVLGLDLKSLFGEFFASRWHPGSLAFLLFADIAIAILLLNDLRVKESLMLGRRMGILVTCMLVFFVVSLCIPEYGAEMLASNTVKIGLLALLTIGVPRGIAYAPPERAHAL